MYRPLPETPSDRDREIYYACLGGLTQRQAAEKFELTQPRVCQIVKQFRLWRVAYATEEEFSGPEQDFLANEALLELCERGKQMALQGWEMSLVPQQQETDEGRGRWIPAKPDMRCVKQLIECGEKAVEATKNMESARYLLRCERDRDPKYQEEQARLSREMWRRRVEEQKRRDREEAERKAAEEAAAAAVHDAALRRPSEVGTVAAAPSARGPVAARALIKTSANPQNPRGKGPASGLSNSPADAGVRRSEAASAPSPAAKPAVLARNVNSSDAGSVGYERLSNPPPPTPDDPWPDKTESHPAAATLAQMREKEREISALTQQMQKQKQLQRRSA